jgi:hypothetical protein
MKRRIFCKIVGIKQCQCPEDEHIKLYTEVPETTMYTDVDGKAVKCGTHSRYKKSCPICKEVAGEI